MDASDGGVAPGVAGRDAAGLATPDADCDGTAVGDALEHAARRLATTNASNEPVRRSRFIHADYGPAPGVEQPVIPAHARGSAGVAAADAFPRPIATRTIPRDAWEALAARPEGLAP
jgi:hypothetical protein